MSDSGFSEDRFSAEKNMTGWAFCGISLRRRLFHCAEPFRRNLLYRSAEPTSASIGGLLSCQPHESGGREGGVAGDLREALAEGGGLGSGDGVLALG